MEAAHERRSDGYRIICLVRGPAGDVRSFGYSERGNGVIYDGRWTIEEARRLLEAGERLYIVSPEGSQLELEAHADGIRIKPGQDAENGLDDLPPCG